VSSVDQLAQRLRSHSLSLAVAESLTGGLLASQLAAGPEAGRWFSGGVVTYTREAKQKVLGAGDGPLVSEETAWKMVEGVTRLFGSSAAVAVTGAGGPDGHDGAEPGEVWIAARVGDLARTCRYDFDGSPHAICDQTCLSAIDLLASVLDEAVHHV
jgi:nicotinamide-nucleotide amidase